MNCSMCYKCHSPSASDSSFSVSTCDSPSPSAQSEASPIAGTHMLQSPHLFHTHLSGNARKYPKSLDYISKEVMNAHMQPNITPTKMTENNRCHNSNLVVPRYVDTRFECVLKDKEGLVHSPVESSNCLSDKDWPSDGAVSWASASSHELLRNDTSCDGTAASDVSSPLDMPRLTPVTSPEVELGIRQGESQDQGMSKQGNYTHRDCCACDHCHGGAHQSRWSNIIFSTEQNKEDCIHAPYTSPSASQCGAETRHNTGSREDARKLDVNVLKRLQEHDLKYDVDRPLKESGVLHRTFKVDDAAKHQPVSFRLKNVVEPEYDSFTSASTSTRGNSTSAGSAIDDTERHQKTRCSVPVDHKLLSLFQGHFRVLLQDGSPCYSFSVQDSEEVFFARACKPERLPNEDNRNDFYYAFRSQREDEAKGGWKCWLRKERPASTVEGKMKVSSAPGHIDSKRIDCNRYISETHFVLYSERSQKPAEEEKANKDDQVSPQLHLLPQLSNTVCRHKPMEKFKKVHMELLAVAITTSVQNQRDNRKVNQESSRKELANRDAACESEGSQQKGWGFKFLSQPSKHAYQVMQERLTETPNVGSSTHIEKLQDINGMTETHSAYSHMLHERIDLQSSVRSKRKQQSIAVDMVVILPAGHHGLCDDEDGGCSGPPTPLLERWQSDGACDCGGWDMGCGMWVLRAETLIVHNRRSAIALTDSDQINWILPGRPLEIFSQGCRRRKLLRIEIIETGLFSLSFQAQFSPLQAFATAVAIFHQQIAFK